MVAALLSLRLAEHNACTRARRLTKTRQNATALERTTKSKQFLSSLCESTASMLADRAQQRERVKTDMNRQVLVYVLQHLENSRQTVC